MVDYTNAAGYTTDDSGRRQFQDRDKVNGVNGTSLLATDKNMDRNELVNAVKASGQVLDGMNHAQLALAIQVLGNIRPWSQTLSDAIGGYWLGAVIVDGSGAFWQSTKAANTTAPGAEGANWKSLFDGLATQSWANGQFLRLVSGVGQSVPSLVTFTGATGFNAKVANAPAGPTTGVGGDVANTYWIDTFYARVTALAAEITARTTADAALQSNITNEASARSNADALKANLAGGNTFTSGDQVVTGTNVAGNFSNSGQFVTKETTTGMSAGLKASRNLTTGDSFLALGFVDTGGNYHEHRFDYSGSIYSSTKNDSVAWKADLPVGTVTSTNTYSKVGSIITQTFFVVLPSITSGTGYTINLPTALATGIQGVNVTVGSDANCQISTRDWTKGSFTLVPYLTSSQGTKFSIIVTGD